MGNVVSRPVTAGKALVGRDADLGFLATFLSHAFSDGGALVLHGAQGVGKTELLDATAWIAAADGALVVRTRGVQFEVEVSFAALNQMLLPLLDDVPRLPGPHREALDVAFGLGQGSLPDRLVITNAVLALLDQLSRARPVLMIADDLPWLDRASAWVLSVVARRLYGIRVGFLGALRSDEDTFFDRAGIDERAVEPLDDDAATSLVSAAFPGLAATVRKRIVADAQGNPLALLELPRTLSPLQREALRDLPATLPLSRRLAALYETRISELPTRTRRILLLVALDGTGDPRILGSGAMAAPGAAALAPAERARLVSVDSNTHRIAFRHPLIRAAVVDQSTVVGRRQAHRQLAEMFSDHPERHAWHLAEAAIEPDEHVAELLAQAAYRILRRGDGVGAVATLTRAAELSPRGTDRGRRLAEAAYIGADVTGELGHASQLLAEAHQADPRFEHSLQAAATASLLLLRGDGDLDTAHRLLVGAIQNSEERGGTALEEAIQTLMVVCFYSSRAEMWAPFYRALSRLEPNVPAALALSRRTVADPVRTGAAASEELDAAIAGLVGEVDPTQIVRIASAAAYLDRLGACRHALLRVIRDGRAGAAIGSAIPAMIFVGRDDFLTGQWTEARALVEEAVGLCERHGYELLSWSARYYLGALAALRGDDEVANMMADAIVQWAAPRGIRADVEFFHHIRALAALGSSNFEQAFQEANAISPAGTLASHVPNATWAMFDLVEAAVRSGRQSEAAAHVKAMREANVAALSSRLALHAAAAAAMVAPDDEARQLFEHALAIPDVERWQFDVARVHLVYGEHLRRTRAMVKARSHLSTAGETFVRLGARPWNARASNELRATGQTKYSTRDQAMATLTPQELEIARLAAAGLTNKQIAERLFLSHRTVGGHLHRVFPKLGVATRAALRDALSSLPGEEK